MKEKKFRNFAIIWGGQFFSILGSGISAFGLSVWIFYKTGAATPFALSFLCNILPGIIFAPVAGSWADRKNRKSIMMISDSLDACLKMLMAVLLFTDNMQVWMVYPILFFSSMFSTFQGPAYSASIPMLVSEELLSRANGMIQLSQAAQNMIAPLLAGILYPLIGLKGLLIVDFCTYSFGILTVAFVKIPQEIAEATEASGMGLILKDFSASWKILLDRKGFIQIVFVFSFLNFLANISMILLGPIILSNYDSAIYGTVQTIYAVSMLVGGFLASVIPDAKNREARMFAALSLSGLGLFVSGMSPNWIVISGGMFIFFFLVPYANTLFSTSVQTQFDPTTLGRVGALLSAILKLASPFACIMAGPLIDYV
ncbi:MAG: MFS transporter, partial [Eubacterium sp.]|nr:MFS transporter [Eubacterium sp.]